ncbi:uncharacterized protein N7446_001614 [Penicillium canescens]|uniref:ABC transporter domain-containing protein n=1 Tax=Penicillium canescens TaxID=5083 RepID=A0AAD6ICH8_PENCN|nr:uncharacterized protein N7446_001614 [Penicillium canescens]KAJ6043415.1 hypothetical protein N7460_004770 [Penicillium canescens]KAJ6054892.1 hypothetical protein N7444_003990 [Penicillium canescens]KAJ6073837.1 hypothetical protein N7446_001614 [Penicillium canescens]
MVLRTTLRPRVLRLVPFRPTRFVSSAPVIRIENGTFYKRYPTDVEDSPNPPLFPNLNFTLPSERTSKEEGANLQHWAIIGPSEKTDLLHILRGRDVCLPANARSYPYLLLDKVAAKDPRLRSVSNAIRYIGFSGEGSEAIGGTRGAYLSARYESHREETDWTVEQYLRGQTSLNPMEGENAGLVPHEQFFKQIMTHLHLQKLLDMPVANLSNGQTRRARIAKALLRRPEVLLLDEPFMGLDPATTRSISGLLHNLAERQSPRLILALRPQDKVPQWITHTMILGNNHQALLQGPKSEVDETIKVWSHFSDPFAPLTFTYDQNVAFQKMKTDMEAGFLDADLLQSLTNGVNTTFPRESATYLGGEPIIEMEGVRVQYGEKAVLGNWTQEVNNKTVDGLHWRVRRGQRWAIIGANGSGKTTLVSMITSDHPQTYAQPVKIFGRSRLPEPGKPGISIFELQSRIGHSSPEIHAFFPRQLTVRQAVESAFAETFLSKPKLNSELDLDVNAVLKHFQPELDPAAAKSEIPEVSTEMFPKIPKPSQAGSKRGYVPPEHHCDYADDIRFGELTTAQQRIVLFIRALVHRPDIVILDEAFSGLSATQRDKCIDFIDCGERPRAARLAVQRNAKPTYRFNGLTREQSLLVISHVPEEIPDSVRYFLRLPSDPGVNQAPLDFRFGMLSTNSLLRKPSVWDIVWSGGKAFKDATRRTSRRNSEDVGAQDLIDFEYYTV